MSFPAVQLALPALSLPSAYVQALSCFGHSLVEAVSLDGLGWASFSPHDMIGPSGQTGIPIRSSRNLTEKGKISTTSWLEGWAWPVWL